VTRFRLAAGGARDERLSGLAGRIIPADGPAHGKVAQRPAVPLTPIGRPENLG